MARKSTIAFAEKTLTPEQFAAWNAMPVKLSKTQLKAGEVPPTGEDAEEEEEGTEPEQKDHPIKAEEEQPPATAAQLKQARYIYADEGAITVDDDAVVAEAEDGVWVQAWVYLPDDEGDEGDEGDEEEE